MSTIRYQSSMPDKFEVTKGHAGPNDKPCAVQLAVLHPLEASEKNYQKHNLNLQLEMLRKSSGIAAPLKLVMEVQATQKVGRLPFLPSRNVHYQVLTGEDETIDFADYLGTFDADEVYRQPHAIMEKKWKL